MNPTEEAMPVGNEEIWVNLPVKERHISHGRAALCRLCPIALALKDILHDRYYVEVLNDEIRIYVVGGFRFIHHQPVTGVPYQFIQRFDAGHKVSPIEFPLSLPTYLLRPEVLERAQVEWREHLERLDSKSGLSKIEEYDQVAMHG